MSIFGPKDTRTKEQKLEAMANQTASPHEAEVARRKLAEHRASHQPGSHPIFNRRGDNYFADTFGINTNDKRTDPQGRESIVTLRVSGMSHEDFMNWMRRAQRYPHHRDPEPHVYTASRGDALGCDTCARSKDNPRAHHVKTLGG